jgi:single-strand DNA-binding protein
MANINRVIVTGNLTRDPELRTTSSGMPVCSLRIAVNTRRKSGDEWVEKPNYFDVTVWGKQGQNCASYLEKGRPVAIDGRLEWREYTKEGESSPRQAVEIVAESVQFLGGRDGSTESGSVPPPMTGSGRTRTSHPDDDVPF